MPGVISCTWLPVVITSDKTPEPGKGSTFIPLDASAVLLPVSLYSVTHAAWDVDTFRRAYVLGVVNDVLDTASFAMLTVTGVVVLAPAGVVHVTFPAPLLDNTCPLTPLLVGYISPPAVNAPSMVTPVEVVVNLVILFCLRVTPPDEENSAYV